MITVLVYIPCPDMVHAKSLAKSLLDQQLAACANIIPQMHSLYIWEGELKDEQEVLLLIKVSQEREQELINVAAKLHPYTCPCILSFSARNGYLPFDQWVIEKTLSKTQK